MVKNQNNIWMVFCLIAAMIMSMVSCSSTDQQGGEYDDYGNNYGNGEEVNNAEGNENGEEGGEETNNESYNEFENGQELGLQQNGNGYENYGAEESENAYASNEYGGNNLALENNAYGEENGGEYVNNAAASNDLLADTEQSNNGLGVDNAGYDAGGYDAAPVNAAADTPALDAPVNAVESAPSGGVVKYIRETTSVFDRPNGSSVGSKVVGEHPVVFEEGEFHRDAKGRYIPSSALSLRGVGRPREGGVWRSNSGGY